ncbi:Nif3-like dinuclear metal center hexameric protein [Corynebacterium crudilactis]|uniref:GTP cyclohydrolase 1 type 2 homolog n=1 Tax=Corynebacterium crudilactis TaxID=1652495 RepID=A0A172QUT9_9CORY|nr:Nif3-like dinuclear metal center hexameric protein [Corynebacterium crudilactis]ANE04475.1 Nif3-like dinuclear metal center hexameric protein [Corynebacterium crudilactis]
MIEVTVGEIRRIMDEAYPPALAESWDKVGLICGDPAASVRKVGLALDCTQEVAEKAVALGLDMLIIHHPLLLRGVTSVAADEPKGKVIHTLIRGGVALFSAHTNADSARPGVNDKLAELVGIKAGRPIAPRLLGGMDKWGVHVLPKDAAPLKKMLFDAGAGAIGDYRECSFEFEGTGQFRPVEGANPTEGDVDKLFKAPELRIEFVAPRNLRARLTSVLREAHPYEEPAFDIVEMHSAESLENATGLGRIGELPEPMRLADLVQQVANNLPETAWGIRATGDPDQMVSRVAVSSGSGDSFLSDVIKLGVDVYVTSDLRHHPVDEYLRDGGPAVIDTAHWASEFPWTAQAQEILQEKAPQIEVDVISIRTDPWTMSAHAQPSMDRVN